MKNKILMMIVAATVCISGYAQDDDIYFVPSKKEKTQTKQSVYQEYSETEDWSKGRTDGGRDIDEYNRRGNYDYEATDSTYIEEDISADGGTYTTRLVRFHSPRVGVYVSSPYYVDVYDYYWSDPWYYDSWHYGWYGSSWGWRPYYSWYGWHNPWYHGWGASWGWHPPYHHHHPPHHSSRPNYAYRGPGNRYGGRNNYNATVNRPATNRPSSGRLFNTRTSTNRTTGTTTGTTRPSTRYNTSTQKTNNSSSRPSRTYSTPSRSNSGSSYSRPSNSGSNRSFGSGGGRSFGSGGSRSSRR